MERAPRSERLWFTHSNVRSISLYLHTIRAYIQQSSITWSMWQHIFVAYALLNIELDFSSLDLNCSLAFVFEHCCCDGNIVSDTERKHVTPIKLYFDAHVPISNQAIYVSLLCVNGFYFLRLKIELQAHCRNKFSRWSIHSLDEKIETALNSHESVVCWIKIANEMDFIS